MWKHAPGLLILLDQCELTPEAESLFKKFERLNYFETLSIDEVNEIKGLEYQHVFIFIKKGLFDEIQMGFKGSGQRVYDERRLLRIPFSRAKDSLVTFAIDDV
jgi:superfamily I DNA/RNA helicase